MSGRRVPKRDDALMLIRQDDQQTWTPDVTVKIQISPRWKVTDHPLESGATVSDHVQQTPQPIVATCILSENRTAPLQGGRTYLQQMVAWLRETADAGRLVDVRTRRLGIFRSYVIVAAPHAIDNVSRLQFELELREVKIATSSTVLISVEVVTDDVAAGAPDEVDAGEQATTTTDEDPEAEDSDSSILYDLIFGEPQPEEAA